jgi:hypothetical protein
MKNSYFQSMRGMKPLGVHFPGAGADGQRKILFWSVRAAAQSAAYL